MADGIDLPATGVKALTDDTGAGGHAQVVKLAIATDGSATLIPADGTDGLLVNLGTNNDVAATLSAETTKVIGTVNVASSQTIAVTQATAANLNGTVVLTDGSHNIAFEQPTGDTEAPSAWTIPVENYGMWFNGSTWDRARGTAADGLLVNLGTNNDVAATLSAETTKVIGTVNVASGQSIGVSSIAAGTNNIGDVDVLTVPADPFGANADAASATGSISAKLRFIASTGIPVTGTVTVGSHAVTNAGTFATQIDGAALTALQLIDDPVLADSAGFTLGTTKVVGAGYVVDDTSTDLLTENDIGAARITTNRLQLFYPGEPPSADTGTGGTQTGTTAQDVMAAAASLYNYLCWVSVYNSSSTNTFATLKDDSTTKMVIPLPAYGGALIQFARPLRNAVVNKAFTITSGTGVTTAYYYGGGYRASI